jgi:hypothetical protein
VAWGVPRKEASWQFPIVQKPPRQNIGEPVKRNSNPVVFGKNFPRTLWLCFQGEECFALLLDRNVPNSEYALPTGRGSSCFMHREVAPSTLQTERQHTPRSPPDWFLLSLRPAFRREQSNRNRGMEHKSAPAYLEKASKLPATRILTAQTTFSRHRL